VGNAEVLVDGLTLPEGMRWHDGRAWFSDLYNRRVCSIREDGSDLRVEASFDAIPSGIGWLPDGRLLVALQETAVVARRERDGSVETHADLSSVTCGWLNDMVVAADGTAYVGCHGFDINHNEPFATGPIMKVSPAGEVTVVGEPAAFSNGATIVDGTLVIAESFANRLSQYDIDAAGNLHSRRDWATFGPEPTAVDLAERYTELVVAPDGISVVDAEGAIWVADFTKTYALRVLPGGEIADRVDTAGGLHCYSVALGGAEGTTLFLCTAPGDDLDPDVRKNDPRGAIQACGVDVALA
jgi:sugar lactone lactonase YvrE